MIILGDRYTFSKIELDRLRKKFRSIQHVSYSKLSTEESIETIEAMIESSEGKLIVLNTKVALHAELLAYLTKLEAEGVHYITIDHFLEQYLSKCLIGEESVSAEFLKNIHPYTSFQYFQKRIIDYVSVLILLLPTLLFILYSWYRTYRESPGPLFFRQKRVGFEEKEFTCIKLRSMHTNAEEDGAKFASVNDPRTFPWGKVIRHKKIDELIQLWNVLKGDMHFVGPRPERKIWTKEFEKVVPYYAHRHLVAPGITGLAQIKYHYGAGQLDAKEKLMYDLYYIKNWSFWLEIEIIWKTAMFVLTKKRYDLSNF